MTIGPYRVKEGLKGMIYAGDNTRSVTINLIGTNVDGTREKIKTLMTNSGFSNWTVEFHTGEGEYWFEVIATGGWRLYKHSGVAAGRHW